MTTATGRPHRGTESPDRSTPPVLEREDRACAGIDPEVFYPDRGDSKTAKQARELCGRCPVRQPCLDWAVETRQRWGVWGGTTPEERKAILRRSA